MIPWGGSWGACHNDPNSDNFKRRNKHQGGDRFSFAPSLLTQLPRLNKSGLSVARDFVRGKTTSLPFTFLEKAFPTEAQDIILEGMRAHVATFFFVCDLLRSSGVYPHAHVLVVTVYKRLVECSCR